MNKTLNLLSLKSRIHHFRCSLFLKKEKLKSDGLNFMDKFRNVQIVQTTH